MPRNVSPRIMRQNQTEDLWSLFTNLREVNRHRHRKTAQDQDAGIELLRV